MEATWTVVGVLVPILLGWSFGMLGLATPDFRNARILCRISFLVLTVWTLIWEFVTQAGRANRVWVMVGVGAANAVIFPLYILYIGRREKAHLAIPVSPEAVPQENPESSDSRLQVTLSDPRLLVSVDQLKKDGEGFASAIGVVLKNVGGSEAHNVRLDDMLLTQKVIEFPVNIPALAIGESTHPIAGRITAYGPLQMFDIARAMMEEWDHQKKALADVIPCPASATYTNFAGNKFKASWNFEFHPFVYRSWAQRVHKHTENFLPDTLGPYITVSAVLTERVD